MTDYEETLEKLEDEVNEAEEEFSRIADEGEMGPKEEKAVDLIGEIHEQIDFLEDQLERINETD